MQGQRKRPKKSAIVPQPHEALRQARARAEGDKREGEKKATY